MTDGGEAAQSSDEVDDPLESNDPQDSDDAVVQRGRPITRRRVLIGLALGLGSLVTAGAWFDLTGSRPQRDTTASSR